MRTDKVEAISPDVAALVPHACLLQIQSNYEILKRAERRAVDFILDNPTRISELTIVDFAEEAGCSEATVVRLSKRLGYEGFPELKRDFALHHTVNDASVYADSAGLDYADISPDDLPMTVLEKVVQTTIKGLNDTVDIMSSEEYDRAVDAIVSAKKVMFSGLGDAGIVALEARQRFLRAGKTTMASLDPDTQLMLAAQLEPGDVLFAISHSGRSRTVMDTVRRAKEAGATVVAITNFPVSPLTKKSDIVLLTAVFTKYRTVEVMAKRVTQLCVLESLSVNYLNRLGPSAIERLRRTEASVDVNKV